MNSSTTSIHNQKLLQQILSSFYLFSFSLLPPLNLLALISRLISYYSNQMNS
ncbi:unnamed protein product, partial [Amoebophrya sp. A25]|eukprot:GSA25T00017868001.1